LVKQSSFLDVSFHQPILNQSQTVALVVLLVLKAAVVVAARSSKHSSSKKASCRVFLYIQETKTAEQPARTEAGRI
jgi:hypothetical protein